MDAHDRMFGEIAVRLELLTREQLGACRKAQAESAGKRSLREHALSLGMMSESEVQLVTEQQRKVLDRRREARDAASVTQSERPSKQPPVRGRTITASGTGGAAVAAAVQAPGRDSQPGLRPESRTRPAVSSPPPIPAEARPNSAPPTARGSSGPVATNRADDTAGRLEREPTVPRVPHEPRSLLGMGLIVPDLENTPLDPHAAAEARALSSDSLPPAAPARDERPGKRTEVPPSRARRVASAPANTNQAAPRPSPARGAGGTLLAGSGQLQQRAQTGGFGPGEGALRPAADRGWRNPSRPPPSSQSTAPPELLEASGLPIGLRGATAAWSPASQPPGADPQAPQPTAAQAFLADSARQVPMGNAAKQVALGDNRYLDQLLALAIDTGASDLHAHSGSPVLARVDGALWPLTADAPLAPPAAEQVIAEIMTDAQWDELQLSGEVRFAYELAGVGRFRAHAYRQAHGLDIVFRSLPEHIVDPKDLSLPSRMLMHVLEARSGLFLVSGPPGSGKTTTLATFGHVLANEHNLYVATAEAPIEIVHEPGLGMIEQREIPLHAHNFAECIEQSVALGADVIVISELSTPSATLAALQAALSGCVVLAAVQAESPWTALAQLLSHFSGPERVYARAKLALALRAVFTQHLMPRSSARGRIPAVEMLLGTPQVVHMIAEEQLEGLEALISQLQHVPGMQTLESALHDLARARLITPEVALRAARRERAEAGA